VLSSEKFASHAATVEAWESDPTVLAVGAVVVVTVAALVELLGDVLEWSAIATVTMTPRMITTISVDNIATPRSERARTVTMVRNCRFDRRRRRMVSS
jgi:hypothetical protein